jgi:S1-C subfamily serine protease
MPTGDNFTHTDFLRPAGKSLLMYASNKDYIQSICAPFGFQLRNTHTQHTAGTGVLVTTMENGSVAARAGLFRADKITRVNNVKTETLEEWAAECQKSFEAGIVPLFTINRAGQSNLNVLMQEPQDGA